jgi:integrase
MTEHRKGGGFDLAAAMTRVSETTEADDLTLAELLAAYRARNPSTEFHWRLRKWLQAFGDRCAWTLATEELEIAAQAMREAGYSVGSVNRDLGALGSLYRWAKKQRLCPRGFMSPTLAIRREAEPIRVVEADEIVVQRIRDAALGSPDPAFRAFIWLLLDSGARKSEVLERRWREVDLDAGEIHCPDGKTGARVLFFSPETARLLKRIRPKGACAEHFVFPGKRGAPVATFRRPWKQLTESIDMPHLHLHDLRHIAAARLLKAGNTLAVSAQALGHSPAMLARRYGHLEVAALKQAQQRAWNHGERP